MRGRRARVTHIAATPPTRGPRGVEGGVVGGISSYTKPANQDIEHDRERAIAHLRETYGLTRQEARIGTLIGEGHVIRDAARDLGIQESTARWHLKNVFSKLDIHRQVELVRLILRAQAR